MKKGLLNITGEDLRKVIREALSPTFVIILLGAALLWYTSKLSLNYNYEMPMGIRIDGQKYRITAIVSGRGSAILSQQLSLKRRLKFTLDELSSRPSGETTGALTITPASLKNAINGKSDGDLAIVQVTDAPKFFPRIPEPEPEKTEKTESAREKRRRERREAEAEAAGKAEKKQKNAERQ